MTSQRCGARSTGWWTSPATRWRSAQADPAAHGPGALPYTRRYLGTLRNHFSTIGVNGVNEMVRNLTQGREDINGRPDTPGPCGCWNTCARLADIQEETGHLYNLEATPAEGATYRFARKTSNAGRTSPYRPGQLTLLHEQHAAAVGMTDDPSRALIRQDELQCQYTGGTVLHLAMDETLSSAQACRQLVRRR